MSQCLHDLGQGLPEHRQVRSMGVSEIVRTKILDTRELQRRPPRRPRKGCRTTPTRKEVPGTSLPTLRPAPRNLQCRSFQCHEARLFRFRNFSPNSEAALLQTNVPAPQLHDLIFAASCPEQENHRVQKEPAAALRARPQQPFQLRLLLTADVHRPAEPSHTTGRLAKALDLTYHMPHRETYLGTLRPRPDGGQGRHVPVHRGVAPARTSAGRARLKTRFRGRDHLWRHGLDKGGSKLFPPPGHVLAVLVRRAREFGKVAGLIESQELAHRRPASTHPGLQLPLCLLGTLLRAVFGRARPMSMRVPSQTHRPLPAPLTLRFALPEIGQGTPPLRDMCGMRPSSAIPTPRPAH